MPFLLPHQQRQSTESKLITKDDDQNRTCNQQEGLKYSALEVFLNDMRYINPRFTYLLTSWVVQMICTETLGASVSGYMVLTTTRQYQDSSYQSNRHQQKPQGLMVMMRYRQTDWVF